MICCEPRHDGQSLILSTPWLCWNPCCDTSCFVPVYRFVSSPFSRPCTTRAQGSTEALEQGCLRMRKPVLLRWKKQHELRADAPTTKESEMKLDCSVGSFGLSSSRPRDFSNFDSVKWDWGTISVYISPLQTGSPQFQPRRQS